MDLIMKFACDEAGASALEYAIVLSLIGIGLIIASITVFWQSPHRHLHLYMGKLAGG